MKFIVTVSQVLQVEAEDEDDACIIADEMFDFGSAWFEVEVGEDE